MSSGEASEYNDLTCLCLLPLVLLQGRARHSIRRRPPSRRHRKSSSGDEVGVADSEGDVSLSSPSEPEVKTPGGGEKEEAGELFKQEGQTDEVKEDKTDASTCPEKNESHEEDRSEISAEPGEEDEKKEEAEEGSKGGEEGEGSSSGRKEEEEEKNSEEKKEEDLTEGETNTDCKEEEKTQVIPAFHTATVHCLLSSKQAGW